MEQPTQEQIKEFWEWCGARCLKCGGLITSIIKPDKCNCHSFELDLDLNNLFKYATDAVVGISIRFYPGGCECQVTYITEAGFDGATAFMANTEEEGYTEANSKKKSALALFWALWQVKEASK